MYWPASAALTSSTTSRLVYTDPDDVTVTSTRPSTPLSSVMYRPPWLLLPRCDVIVTSRRGPGETRLSHCNGEKGKVLPYSLPSAGPGADLGVQAVSPQVAVSHPLGGIGCHYFPPGLRLPSQPKSVTAYRPVPNYTAW